MAVERLQQALLVSSQSVSFTLLTVPGTPTSDKHQNLEYLQFNNT
jgi:hypothetical protein